MAFREKIVIAILIYSPPTRKSVISRINPAAAVALTISRQICENEIYPVAISLK
jgi:hypothetical protein